MTSLKQLQTQEDIQNFDITSSTMMFGCNPTISKHPLENRNIYIISKDVINNENGEKMILYVDNDKIYVKNLRSFSTLNPIEEVDENNNGNSKE